MIKEIPNNSSTMFIPLKSTTFGCRYNDRGEPHILITNTPCVDMYLKIVDKDITIHKEFHFNDVYAEEEVESFNESPLASYLSSGSGIQILPG